jgi:ABC-type iron transport system FetAB permease component
VHLNVVPDECRDEVVAVVVTVMHTKDGLAMWMLRKRIVRAENVPRLDSYSTAQHSTYRNIHVFASSLDKLLRPQPVVFVEGVVGALEVKRRAKRER